MIDYTKVGKRIKMMRKAALMTQSELSKKLDVSVGYISKLENGTLKIGLEPLYKISKIFRCDLTWFLENDDPDIFDM